MPAPTRKPRQEPQTQPGLHHNQDSQHHYPTPDMIHRRRKCLPNLQAMASQDTTQPHKPVPDDPADEQPSMIIDHPTPAIIYHPERVGFYRVPEETD